MKQTRWAIWAISTLGCVAVVSAILSSAAAFAQPMTPTIAAPTPFTTVVSAGPSRVSIETTRPSVPVGSQFSYVARVDTRVPLDSVQVRMKLFMPSGRLIYQKTFTDRSDKIEPREFVFAREIGDIDLDPAAYPTEISIKVRVGKTESEALVKGALLVYDPKKERRPVALVARISALPLTDAEGRFVVDPSAYVRARDDVMRLSDYIIGDRRARLTLALSPLMLEEWRRVAGGYRYESPEGPVEVSAAEETPRSYSYALGRLAEAAKTGRLEILSSGYSDPDLSQLELAKLTSDIGPQYDMGISAVFSSIAATPSPGTAPFNGCFSERSASKLAEQGIRYAVVSDPCAPGLAPGAYTVSGSRLKVMVSERAQGSIFATGSTDAILAGMFESYLEGEAGPIPVLVGVGPDGASADTVVKVARALSSQPWTKLANAALVQTARGKLPVADLSRSSSTAPAGYWETVAESRRLAQATVAVLGVQDEEALFAGRNSLIAESSAWSGAKGDWAHSERALAFAAKAKATAESVLGRVKLSARPVTLAGTRGEVPITIVNSGDKVLYVRVVTTPSGGMKKGLAPPVQLALQPQDNFVEIPVDLQGGLSGQLRVVVMAGDVMVAETSVPLSASVMDRLVILSGIVVLLGGLLAFIIMRVRKAENARNGASVSG